MTRYALCLFGVLGFAIAGCTPGQDNPAAQLAGTWELTFEEPGDLEGYEIYATFDDNGQLTELSATSPEGGTANLDVDDATTTEVVEHDVTITIPRAGGESVFTGEISEDHNTITGTISQEIELPSGDVEVTLPGSGVTLTRLSPE